METFRALIRGDLSPAGNKISLICQPQETSYSINGFHSVWVDSGTSALALALLDAKAKASNVSAPKVIIPGYCCPDLVSAAVYAGVKPVVVDICVDDASYDLEELRSALLDENVIAVIAVNFLGIKERLTEIKQLIGHKPIKIIEDNAQWFPASRAQHEFMGDYVLFSFGRGKPLSLLGGGALFSIEPLSVSHVVTHAPPTGKKEILKIHAYNILLNPRLYCFLNRAPFLRLGETRYHAHQEITQMASFKRDIFSDNLQLYERRDTKIELSYEDLFASVNVQCLNSLKTPRRLRLLRYPLLCRSAGQRDRVFELTSSLGLGTSPMYQRAIVEIPMVKELVEVQGSLENARQFARRFLTFPTHQYVNNQHLSTLKNELVLLNN